MAILNSLCGDVLKSLQLDAGFLAVSTGPIKFNSWDGTVNLSGGQLTNIAEGFETLGATKGSATISIIPEMRNLFDGIDGARGYYKGGTVIDNWDITMKATITEMTVKNIQRLLVNANVKDTDGLSGSLVSKYETIQPKLDIDKERDYIKYLYWFGTIAGDKKPIIVEMVNVLNMNGFTLTAEDKNTGTAEVEFRPHIDLAKPTEVPVKIYRPKGDESGAEVAKFEELDLKTIKK